MTVPPSLPISFNPPASSGVRVRTASRTFDGAPLHLTFLDGSEPDEGLIEAGLARRDQRDGGGWVELGDSSKRAWVKGGRLTGKSSFRHGARMFFAQHPLPRVAEYNNLTWLRHSGFPAAVPLVAGVLLGRWGLPRAQFLATLKVDKSRNLFALLADATTSKDVRRGSLSDAGHLVAQLHLAGFEHRDFFARNLVRDQAGTLTILDAWSGGPCSTARFSMRDVAGFLADSQGVLKEAEADLFLGAYLSETSSVIEVPTRAQIDREVRAMASAMSRRKSRRG
jgi:hypothetical protein